MKKLSLIALAVMLSSTSALAAASKVYQVSGPVTDLTDKAITVEKGSEKWEIARDGDTKFPDTVKVGSKVTVYYTMTAAKVDDKSATAKPDAKTDAKPTDAKADAKTDTKPEAKPATKAETKPTKKK